MTVDFIRHTWQDWPSTETPITADELNRLEEGVAGLYSDLDGIDLANIEQTVDDLEEAVENFKAGVEITQEEYDNLTQEEKNNGTVYYITDAPSTPAISALDASYNNSTSGLQATNVQSAVDELNSKRAWKWHRSETGQTAISLSGLDIEELFIKVDIGSGGNMTSMSIPGAALSSSSEYFRLGGYQSSSNYQLTIVQVSKPSVSLNSNYINGTNATASSIVSVYYR